MSLICIKMLEFCLVYDKNATAKAARPTVVSFDVRRTFLRSSLMTPMVAELRLPSEQYYALQLDVS